MAERRRCVPLVALLALFPCLSSCSLTVPGHDACTGTPECRAAFGLGSTCGDDGLCHPSPRHPRCGRTFPPNVFEQPELYADAFVVGAIADETLETHLARQNAVQLAFSEAADQGGIDGRPVAVVFCTDEVEPTLDELNQEQAAVEVTRYLVEDLAVRAIVGPPSSNAAEAAFAVSRSADAVLVSPSATSPELTQLEPAASDEAPGLLWRTVPPDSLQGRVIASDLEMRSVSNVALIVEEGSYGDGLADVFEGAFSGTVRRLSFSTASERNEAATTAGSGTFEEVLFISSQTTDASAFLLFAASFGGYADKELFLTDSAKNSDLLSSAASASSIFARVRGTAPAPLSGTTYQAFLASYRAEFREEAIAFSFSAHAYDAAYLTLLGAMWASLQEDGGMSGTHLARGFRRLSEGTPVSLGPSALAMARDRFRLGEAIDIEGASGALLYDDVTEETSGPIEVWTIRMDGAGFDSAYTVTP